MHKQEIADLFDEALNDLDDLPRDEDVLAVITMVMAAIIAVVFDQDEYQAVAKETGKILGKGLEKWTGFESYMN